MIAAYIIRKFMKISYPSSYYGVGRHNPTAKLHIAKRGLNYYTYAHRLGGIMAGNGRKRSPSRGRKRSRSTSANRSASTPATVRHSRTKKKAKYVSKSRSRTRSRSVARQVEEGGQHNDLSSTTIYYRNGRVPKKYRGVVKSCIQHQYGYQYTNTQTGIQNITTIGSLVTRSQIFNAGTTGAVVGADSWPGNPFEMNPYAANTGSALLQSITQPSQDKAYMHHINGEIDLTGLESVAQEVTLYLVKYKISSNSTLAGEWTSVLQTGPMYNQPASVNPISNVTPAASTYGYPTVLTYGQTPFGHPALRKEFKLLKTRKVTVEPGATVKVKYRIDYNRMLSKEYFNDAGAAEYLNGWTMQWMALIRAAPVFDSVTKKMTPGPVDVGFQHTYKIKFSYPMEKRLYAYRTDAGFVVQQTLANEKQVNDVDQVVSVTQAV